MVSVTLDDVTKLRADWANAENFVITAEEKTDEIAPNRVTILLRPAAVEQLRAALAKPYVDRKGF